MVKKVKEKYNWIKVISDTIICNNKIADIVYTWDLEAVRCSECGFPLSSMTYYEPDHLIKYCPGCGGLIIGIENPYPPKEKNE